MSDMILRLATEDDLKFLFELRNDPVIYKFNKTNRTPITWEQHVTWFKRSAVSSTRKIFVGTINSENIGTIRYDFEDGYYRLSWAVTKESQGQGFGTAMLKQICAAVTPVLAEINKENHASLKIAKKCGLVLLSEEEGFQSYVSPQKQ